LAYCLTPRLANADSLERLSLWATAATLYMSCYFSVPNISASTALVLGLALVGINVVVVAYYGLQIVNHFRHRAVKASNFVPAYRVAGWHASGCLHLSSTCNKQEDMQPRVSQW
jgi:hypothetical protein